MRVFLVRKANRPSFSSLCWKMPGTRIFVVGKNDEITVPLWGLSLSLVINASVSVGRNSFNVQLSALMCITVPTFVGQVAEHVDEVCKQTSKYADPGESIYLRVHCPR